VALSLDVLPCFLRPLRWMMIDQELGVLAVIITELYKDMRNFAAILALTLLGFGASMVGLSGSLLGRADSQGFWLPAWAMFGEYGSILDPAAGTDELSSSAQTGPVHWGVLVLWIFNFFSQILLVNVLIAMLSETYQVPYSYYVVIIITELLIINALRDLSGARHRPRNR